MRKVAVDCGPLTSGHAVRGVGTYVRELIKGIKRLSDQDKELIVDIFDFSTNHQSLITNHYDIVHYPYFNLFQRTLPFSKPARTVVTIHDLIPLIYPKSYPPGLRGNLRFFLQKILIKSVDGIITPSETSKKDIVRFLGIPAEKIAVIYEAPGAIFKKLPQNASVLQSTKAKYKLPSKFALYVGDINYNKNISGLIRACKIAKMPLVLVGKQALDIEEQGLGLDILKGPKDWIRFLFNIPHPELAHYEDLLEEFGRSKKIIRTGFVPEADLLAIYNLAAVYCQPSFYEGFGLPVLEAMACGTPVVASRTQALVEIADKAALFADSKNPKEIAERINEVLRNPTTLALRGARRVKNFSWIKAAKETIEFYLNVIGE